MKKFLLVAVLIGLTAVFAFAENFNIKNGTGYTIYEVYVSNSNSSNWGDDILDSDEVLRADRTVRIELPNSWRGGNIDILAIDQDGDTYTLHDRRVKNGDTITVTLADLD